MTSSRIGKYDSEDVSIAVSGGTRHRVLYHPPRDAKGRKRRSVNASQRYLVLYQLVSDNREHENQLQARLCGGYLVLYHLKSRLTPLLAPFFDIGVATGKIAGSLPCQPCPLSSLFTRLLAPGAKTGPLAITDTWIGDKKLAAELAVLGQ
jgi:hypothetical protein